MKLNKAELASIDVEKKKPTLADRGVREVLAKYLDQLVEAGLGEMQVVYPFGVANYIKGGVAKDLNDEYVAPLVVLSTTLYLGKIPDDAEQKAQVILERLGQSGCFSMTAEYSYPATGNEIGLDMKIGSITVNGRSEKLSSMLVREQLAKYLDQLKRLGCEMLVSLSNEGDLQPYICVDEAGGLITERDQDGKKIEVPRVSVPTKILFKKNPETEEVEKIINEMIGSGLFSGMVSGKVNC